MSESSIHADDTDFADEMENIRVIRHHRRVSAIQNKIQMFYVSCVSSKVYRKTVSFENVKPARF